MEHLSSEEKKANRDHRGIDRHDSSKRTQISRRGEEFGTTSQSDKYRTEMGQIFDGSFEHAASYGENIFGWQVKGAPNMQVGIDPNKSHSGARSLRMRFQARTNLDEFNVSQLVAVQPQTEYEFSCYVSTDKLETGSAPLVQIVDAGGGAEFVSTPQAPNGTNDMEPHHLHFQDRRKDGSNNSQGRAHLVQH